MIVSACTKLHRALGHPSTERCVKYMRLAGASETAVNTMREVSANCDACRNQAQRNPRSIATVNDSTVDFNTIVGSDTVDDGNVKFLLMVDHGTRFSMVVKIANKQADTIVKTLQFRWISIFGSPKRWHSDAGG